MPVHHGRSLLPRQERRLFFLRRLHVAAFHQLIMLLMYHCQFDHLGQPDPCQPDVGGIAKVRSQALVPERPLRSLDAVPEHPSVLERRLRLEAGIIVRVTPQPLMSTGWRSQRRPQALNEEDLIPNSCS